MPTPKFPGQITRAYPPPHAAARAAASGKKQLYGHAVVGADGRGLGSRRRFRRAVASTASLLAV
jgi:hypothetical protein